MNIPANLVPNSDQVAHGFRWLLAAGGSFLVTNGVASDSSVALWTGIAITLTPLVQGAFAHTQAAIIAKASRVPGIAEPIRIAPEAPAALQALAADRSIPMVQPEAPTPNPYATSRRL